MVDNSHRVNTTGASHVHCYTRRRDIVVMVTVILKEELLTLVVENDIR